MRSRRREQEREWKRPRVRWKGASARASVCLDSDVRRARAAHTLPMSGRRLTKAVVPGLQQELPWWRMLSTPATMRLAETLRGPQWNSTARARMNLYCIAGGAVYDQHCL